MTDTTAASDPPGAAPPSARLGYQPALDGVRAIAVTLVVLFHYSWGQPNPVHGGFLGVDIFFVLSGFLITTLLLQEHASFGTVSLRRFYARRALRLLPALAVLLAFALVVHLTVSDAPGFRPQIYGLLGTLFYVANWVRIYRGSALGLLSPTWSLAIEEQFYLLWPVILIFLLRRRLRLRTIAAITAAGALLAAVRRIDVWRTQLRSADFTIYFFRATGRQVSNRAAGTFVQREIVWNRIYFGSDTRADTLLVGCFAAIVLVWLLPRLGARARTRLSAASGFAFVATAVIVARAFTIRSGWMTIWGFPALEICIAIVIAGLVAAPRAPLARLLGLAPAAWIGRRSYAIYLFHIVVFYYCNRTRVHLPPSLSFLFQMAMILVAAELSYRLVEAPMLRRKRHFEPQLTAPTRSAVA